MSVHVAGTEPYPWPYDGRLEPAALALVLAGWDDGWLVRSHDIASAHEQVATLAAAVHVLGAPVVTIAHAGATTSALAGRTVPLWVAAFGIDGFYGSSLDALLRSRGCTHLLIAGNGLEGPVHSTLRSANDRGYECLLVADACAPLTDDLMAASAKTVTMSGGIFGAVGSTGAMLEALRHAHPSPSDQEI
jgi:biuret amidohydrolase